MSTNSFLNPKPRNFKPTKINDFTVINHHIEGDWRSHPYVQDLQHPRLGKPRGLQILDTRMVFPRPSLNVVLDSINLAQTIYLEYCEELLRTG